MRSTAVRDGRSCEAAFDIYGAKIVKNGIDKQVEVGKLRVNDISIFFNQSSVWGAVSYGGCQ